ncbi:MAG: minor capsid protein [Oscillospiraceae bacterium]
MLTCDDVLSLVESFSLAEYYYIGKLDNKKDKSIGVYNGDKLPNRVCLGGYENNLYDVQRFTILIHWNSNPNDTEIIANTLYEKLSLINYKNINNKYIYYISMLYNQSIDVSTDDNGIYERVIDIEIYSRKD